MKKYKNFSKECKNQNIRLVKKDLSIQTFSNVSIRINEKYFVIKPSGVIPNKIDINQLSEPAKIENNPDLGHESKD